MKLSQFQVRLYRNIVDSGEVVVEDDVTCLVGKNESGKTSLLEALYSLKPAYPSLSHVTVTTDYPRWRKVRDERDGNLEDALPISATFQLEDDDLAILRPMLPFEIPSTARLHVAKSYAGVTTVRLDIPIADLVASLAESALLSEAQRAIAREARSLEELDKAVSDQLAGSDKRTRASASLLEYQTLIRKAASVQEGNITADLRKALEGLIPTFFYFSEYSTLPGRIDLSDLLQKASNNRKALDEAEQTSLSLLHLVGVEGKEFMEADFEIRIAELEAAANEVSRQVFEYWTQNQDLAVNFQSDSATVPGPQGQPVVVHRFLDVRLTDLRHQMTTNFRSRSSGFQWFFSFVVAFSEFERQRNVVVLLDEPGLSLHGRAQDDLLRFIHERLGSKTQVIYTTHSPFMVNPRRLAAVRLVEDQSSRAKPDFGAKVTTDVLTVTGDTLFPLQAALGYDLAQNLFVGPDNLVVEGPSDLAYLTFLSERLAQLGRRHLDSRLRIVPVGGADKVPTFVALLGSHLAVTVLVDAKAAKSQRLADMINKGMLQSSRLVSVGQVSPIPGANIEDLFEPEEYLSLYNAAFSAAVKKSDLQGSDSIVNQIERLLGAQYDHLAPALALIRPPADKQPSFCEATLARYESLFAMLNATLLPPS